MATLPAEQRTFIGVDDQRRDALNSRDTSTSRDVYGSPPHAAVHVNMKVTHKPSDLESGKFLEEAPGQLPFDDFIGGSYARPVGHNLSAPRPSQQQIPPMSNGPTKVQQNPTYNGDQHSPPQLPRLHSDGPPTPHSRPELPHASKSAPDPREGKPRKTPELLEVDPFGVRFHEESPFEAARRAQRMDDGRAPSLRSSERAPPINGRFPSIKPGEIIPSGFLRLTNAPPTFLPPLEAPPFPPTVQNPIRPAHFPSSLHPPLPSPDSFPAPSQQQPSSQQQTHLPYSLSRRTPPPRPAYPATQEPPGGQSSRQPQLGVPRPDLYQNDPPISSSRSLRLPHQYGGLANPPPQQDRSDLSPSPRRHTYIARDGASSNFAPSAGTPIPSLPVPSLPHGQAHSHRLSPPPSPSSTSLRQPPHLPSASHPSTRDKHRYTLPSPPAFQTQFEPPVPTPVRLPSQNVSTPQALNGIHSPPPPSRSPRPESSRPPRLTPKPVMPQLLAPLATEDQRTGRGGAGQLQRSMTSATTTAEKGGFLSKTKSILRKRSSTTGIKTHVDGAIPYTPAMPNLVEENGVGGGKSGKRLLSRRK